MGSGLSSSLTVAQIDQLTNEYNEMKSKQYSEAEIKEALGALITSVGKDSTKSEFEKRKERAKHTIMISLHVSSMERSARMLQKELEAQGYRVWICTDMSGGTDYRTAIVEAVRTCTIFLPLINSAWANSGSACNVVQIL